MMRWPCPASRPVVSVSRTICRTRAILTAAEAEVDGLVRQAIDAFIAGVARVTLYPVPGDAVTDHERIELLPEVDVLHRLLVGRAPVAALPVADPGRDAVLDVLRVGIHFDLAGSGQ